MREGWKSTSARRAHRLATLACAAALLPAGGAAAAQRSHPRHSGRSEAERTLRYWTPARRASTPPLDGGRAARIAPATASFSPVAEPTVPPFSFNGRLFVIQGRERGYCSATAINSPSRRLILTAGHCVNTGPRGRRHRATWSRYLEFVPAYSNGVAPFGAFVAHRKSVYALGHWTKTGNPDFDFGAVMTDRSAAGVAVADAVGGGATVALDQPRKQWFQTFGYPGKVNAMQGCESPYVGDDALTYRIPGPPTMAIRCRWTPGASGGGWLIENGTQIDGLTSYGKREDDTHTFGPYFSSKTVGHLIAGF